MMCAPLPTSGSVRLLRRSLLQKSRQLQQKASSLQLQEKGIKKKEKKEYPPPPPGFLFSGHFATAAIDLLEEGF